MCIKITGPILLDFRLAGTNVSHIGSLKPRPFHQHLASFPTIISRIFHSAENPPRCASVSSQSFFRVVVYQPRTKMQIHSISRIYLKFMASRSCSPIKKVCYPVVVTAIINVQEHKASINTRSAFFEPLFELYSISSNLDPLTSLAESYSRCSSIPVSLFAMRTCVRFLKSLSQ